MEDAGSHRKAASRSRGMGLDSRTSHSDMSSLKKFSKYILAKLWESREIKTWGKNNNYEHWIPQHGSSNSVLNSAGTRVI